MTKKERAIISIEDSMNDGEGVVSGERLLQHLANFFSADQLEELAEFIKEEEGR